MLELLNEDICGLAHSNTRICPFVDLPTRNNDHQEPLFSFSTTRFLHIKIHPLTFSKRFHGEFLHIPYLSGWIKDLLAAASHNVWWNIQNIKSIKLGQTNALSKPFCCGLIQRAMPLLLVWVNVNNPHAKQTKLDFQLPGVRLIVWLGHKRRNPINPPHGAMAPSPELPSSPDLSALLILL